MNHSRTAFDRCTYSVDDDREVSQTPDYILHLSMLQSRVQVTCLACGSARFFGALKKCIAVDDAARVSREFRSFDQVYRFQRTLQPMLHNGQIMRGLGTELHLDKTQEGVAGPPETFSGCCGLR